MKILRACSGSYNSRALIAAKIFSCFYMILILSGVYIHIYILGILLDIHGYLALSSSPIISLTKREGGGETYLMIHGATYFAVCAGNLSPDCLRR